MAGWFHGKSAEFEVMQHARQLFPQASQSGSYRDGKGKCPMIIRGECFFFPKTIRRILDFFEDNMLVNFFRFFFSRTKPCKIIDYTIAISKRHVPIGFGLKIDIHPYSWLIGY